MQSLQSLFIKLSSTQIGSDQHGNKYYQSKYTDFFGRKRRYMIYNGMAEPSKAPAGWYSWLHHLRNDAPSREEKYEWQQERQPNLTGTILAYSPLGKKTCRQKVSADYSAWKPH